jgi:type IV pilus assembly protein PilM
MFLKKPDAYLGVDLGAGGVKIVELKKEKNRPVLFTYGLTRQRQEIHRLLEKTEFKPDLIPQSVNKLSSAKETKHQPIFQVDREHIKNFSRIVRQVCDEAKTVSKIAVASMPVSSVFHAVVTLPIVKKEEFDRILKAEVRKLLPYPLEEMALEYEVVPNSEGETYHEQRVLVNAAPRALVVFYTEVFNQAGLKLESLEPESIALTRALIGRDKATTMLIDIGAERTNFFIVEHAFPITHHSVELGGETINKILINILGIEPDKVNRLKKDLFSYILDSKDVRALSKDEFLRIFSPIIEPIIKEVEYSLALYTGQSSNAGKKPEKIILSGGSAQFPYLAEKISEKFNVKCYVGDPWGRVVYQDGLRPALRSIAPRLAVSIGLALRNVV